MFKHRPAVIAMLHVPALPGTPRASLEINELVDRVRTEAAMLSNLGVDALMIENMHDRPYLRARVGPEIVAALTRVAAEVKTVVGDLPCGLQILAGANREALAVAHAVGLDFVRVEGFIFSHVADEGWMDACAGELMRYRKVIGAERVQVWADLKKKHASHSVTADISLPSMAQAAEYCLADGVIVTGSHTGEAARPEDLSLVAEATDLPVFVGSGMTAENVGQFARNASGFIVGSSLKRDGYWTNPIDPARVKQFVDAVRSGL